MPSSKGKPTDPKLREEVKKEVQQMEKGGGKGSWSAWKAGELARRYEAKGGGYEDTGDNPNKAEKGDPTPKKSAVSKGERKPKGAPVGETKKASTAKGGSSGTAANKKTKSSAQSAPKNKSGSAAKGAAASATKGKRATSSSRKATAASA